jgi:hypothetical protein
MPQSKTDCDSVTVQAVVPAEVAAALRARARTKGCSISSLVRNAVEDKLGAGQAGRLSR